MWTKDDDIFFDEGILKYYEGYQYRTTVELEFLGMKLEKELHKSSEFWKWALTGCSTAIAIHLALSSTWSGFIAAVVGLVVFLIMLSTIPFNSTKKAKLLAINYILKVRGNLTR